MLSVIGDWQKYTDAMKVFRKSHDSLNNPIMARKSKYNRTTFWVPSVQV